MTWTAERLIAFEARVKAAAERGEVNGPVHLSGGNEEQLIGIFRDVKPGDWVFSTWRNHYHALLHGLPEEFVWSEILAGRSISLNSLEHRFYSSAIVGGCLPIAVGVAFGIRRLGKPEHVWCFVGDMAASIGAFHDAMAFSIGHSLPITFVIEDNGFSTNTPTQETWGYGSDWNIVRYYRYKRTGPHVGIRQKEHF